ncbi:MAG: DegV family protein [Candidatus Enterenecus sp.]
MPKVAVVTDSNSGISVEEGKRLGVEVIPMPVQIDGEVYYEGVNLTREEFYRRQAAEAEIVTSQPAPGSVTGLWDKVLKQYDQLVYIPMTAGLSSSCATAQMLAEEYGGRVQVADNRRISVPQRRSVMDALKLAESGADAAEIRETLERQRDDSTIYITVDTLKYLRKGGRVSGVEAMAGTMLNIKPVMEIRDEKLNAIAKVRGMKAARRLMLERVQADLEGRLKPLRDSGELVLSLAYSQVSDEVLADWRAEILAAFPNDRFVEGDPLTLSIACHTGPGALAVGAMRA